MIYVCADDYGFTKESCERIEQCALFGAVNKISVFPNGIISNPESLIKTGALIGIHINLVEGKALSGGGADLLCDEDGFFKHSFAGIFALSFSPFKKRLEELLYREIKAQILHWKEIFGGDFPLIIDSHQHTHMIPLVFKTLLRVISDMKISTEYIRFPSEPVLPYVMCPSLYPTFKPANTAKQWILKFLGLFGKKSLKNSGIKTALFMGVLFSGSMDKKRVEKLLPKYNKIAEKRNCDIELLFHPGYILPGEKLGFGEKFGKFYLSEGRKTEFDTLKTLEI